MGEDCELRMAHLSDLHFTSRMAWPPADARKDEPWAIRLRQLERDLVQVVKPQALFVTGDIADNPAWELTSGSLIEAWTNARAFLGAVGQRLFGDRFEERIFVVPGNHDVKVAGNVRRDELARVAGSRAFRAARWPLKLATRGLLRWHGLTGLGPAVEPVFDRRLAEALESLPANEDMGSRFRSAFGVLAQSRIVERPGLFVYCVDSNSPRDTFLSFAQGVVRASEVLEVKRRADEWAQEAALRASPRIVLLHHHPLPMPLNEISSEPLEADQFHLLRNAGNFLRACVEAGIDFVLHGHKHTRGLSVASFPEHGNARVVVIGAGSVQQPERGQCSYNVLKEAPDGSWRVEVRRWEDGSLQGYAAASPDIQVVDAREARQRQWKGLSPKGRLQRFDRLVTIEEDGDVEVWRLHKRLAPASGERATLPVRFVNTSSRATWEPLNFEDTSKGLNEVRGDVEIYPPARPNEPRDVIVGLRGIGVHTFSREYSRRYNGSDDDAFVFATSENLRAEHVHLEITLPDLLENPRPRLEVYHMKEFDEEDHGRPTAELIARGKLTPDARERVANEPHLRYWHYPPHLHRILFDVELPLPQRVYRICWSLPEDEFEVLAGELEKLREPVRYAIRRLKETLLRLRETLAPRRTVQAFLADIGGAARRKCGLDEPLRIDLAVDNGVEIEVVHALDLVSGGGEPVESALRPSCALGERLRGKAFLRRVALTYAPDVPDSAKDPHRDPHESAIHHQLAIPLVYPPAPPYWPRIAVLTLSSQEEGSRLLPRLANEQIEWITNLAHERVVELARKLGHPFPDLPHLTSGQP